MSRRWWWRPLYSMLKGVLLGLASFGVVLLLPDHLQPWGIIGIVGSVMIFVVWQDLSLRRAMKEWERHRAELERLLHDH